MNVERDSDRKAPAVSRLVYVVDDDESMREALSALLRSVDVPVQTFAAAREFLEFDRPHVPSCLVLDVRLKGQSGLAVQEQVAQSNLRIPIIFITAHGDVAMTVKAMKAGATEFLAKSFRDQDMLDAVEHALAEDEKRRSGERAVSELRRCYDALTPREREVMALVATGLRNKQIAAVLNLSEITVKIHRGQAMRKMGSGSFADFVLKAKTLGISTTAGSN